MLACADAVCAKAASQAILGGICLRSSRQDSAHMLQDDTRILTASGDQTLAMWDTGRAGCLGMFKGHHGSVKCVCTKPACPDVFASGDPQQMPIPLVCLQPVQCCNAFQAECPVVQHVCIDNRLPDCNCLCNRRHSLMGLLAYAHQCVTCCAEAFRACGCKLLSS